MTWKFLCILSLIFDILCRTVEIIRIGNVIGIHVHAMHIHAHMRSDEHYNSIAIYKESSLNNQFLLRICLRGNLIQSYTNLSQVKLNCMSYRKNNYPSDVFCKNTPTDAFG